MRSPQPPTATLPVSRLDGSGARRGRLPPWRVRGARGGSGWWARGMVVALLWLLCSGAGPAASAPLPTPEYQLKAVFLFNFAKFVEWPASAHATKDSPIVLGIVGEDPFGAVLDNAVKGEKLGGRPLEVRRFKEIGEVTGCHLLFISNSLKDQAGDLLKILQGRPVLTVSETPGFAERGGVINFVMADNKVRFEINPQTAAQQSLKVSSKLLQLAHVVDGEGDKNRP